MSFLKIGASSLNASKAFMMLEDGKVVTVMDYIDSPDSARVTALANACGLDITLDHVRRSTNATIAHTYNPASDTTFTTNADLAITPHPPPPPEELPNWSAETSALYAGEQLAPFNVNLIFAVRRPYTPLELSANTLFLQGAAIWRPDPTAPRGPLFTDVIFDYDATFVVNFNELPPQVALQLRNHLKKLRLRQLLLGLIDGIMHADGVITHRASSAFTALQEGCAAADAAMSILPHDVLQVPNDDTCDVNGTFVPWFVSTNDPDNPGNAVYDDSSTPVRRICTHCAEFVGLDSGCQCSGGCDHSSHRIIVMGHVYTTSSEVEWDCIEASITDPDLLHLLFGLPYDLPSMSGQQLFTLAVAHLRTVRGRFSIVTSVITGMM